MVATLKGSHLAGRKARTTVNKRRILRLKNTTLSNVQEWVDALEDGAGCAGDVFGSPLSAGEVVVHLSHDVFLPF